MGSFVAVHSTTVLGTSAMGGGPDALEMGCLYCPRKQTSVSYAADCDVIVRYGGATFADKHLASTIHCVDDEIFEWLQRRETKPRGLRGRDIEQSHLI